MRTKPTFHPDFEVGKRVSFVLEGDNAKGKRMTGKIVGVALQHIINHYIVLLDEPLKVPGWDVPWEAVSLPGSMLRELP